jgi:thymidylate synthase
MHVFDGNTADEVWLKAAAEFRDSQSCRMQGSRAGDTYELNHVTLQIFEPRQRWIVSREPAINPAFALAEVIWIASGRRDSKFINYWNPKLPEFAGSGKTYHGAYGYRLRNQFGRDQLDAAYQALLNNPETRQVLLQIWDPRTDLPLVDGRPSAADIPCNICSLLKIRGGKLHWTQVVRSNDLVLGIPHNFVQFTCLQEIIAAWLSIDVGQYHHVADSLHFYARDSASITNSDSVQPEPNIDVLRFTKPEFESLLSSLVSRMELMTTASLTEKKLRKLTEKTDLSSPLQNWLLVIAADCARRRRWINLAYELMAECKNPALSQLWDRWLARWWHLQFRQAAEAKEIVYVQPFLRLRFS